jgi:hypothetical protein
MGEVCQRKECATDTRSLGDCGDWERSTRYWISPERNAKSVYVGRRAPLPGRCAGGTAAKGVARQKEGAPSVTLLLRTRSEGEGTLGLRDGMLSATGEGFALKQRAPLASCCAGSKLATGEACQKEVAPQSRCCACSEAVTGRGDYVRKR